MKNNTLTTLGLTLTALAALTAAVAAAPAQPKHKISPSQAKAVALRSVPGKATSAKYEFEDGKWQYAVGVTAANKQMWEVEVSSQGKVTDKEKTSAAEESNEAAADTKAAMKAK
jgi:hypothetical protein